MTKDNQKYTEKYKERAEANKREIGAALESFKKTEYFDIDYMNQLRTQAMQIMYDAGKEYLDDHPSIVVSGTDKLSYNGVPIHGLFKQENKNDDTKKLERLVSDIGEMLGSSGSMEAAALDQLVRYQQSKV